MQKKNRCRNTCSKYWNIMELNLMKKLFFSSTSLFNIKLNDGYMIKQSFPLKILIPDFILENFSFHSRDQKMLFLILLKYL